MLSICNISNSVGPTKKVLEPAIGNTIRREIANVFAKKSKLKVTSTSNTFATSQKPLSFFKKNPQYLGVKLKLSNNLTLCNLIIESIDKVKAKGYTLPDEIIVDKKHFHTIEETHIDIDSKGIAGHFYTISQGWDKEPKKLIFLNPSYDWSKVNQKGSTKSLHHPIIHEIGHFAHYEQDPDRFIAYQGQVPVAEALTVSPYAATSSKEFIAEVFVKKVLGEKIDSKIESLFRSNDGPATEAEGIRKVPSAPWPSHDSY